MFLTTDKSRADKNYLPWENDRLIHARIPRIRTEKKAHEKNKKGLVLDFR